MKAEDLMVGDLLTFDECVNDEAPTIIKVTGVFEDTLFAQIDGDTSNDELDYEGLVGIPLTPEILEKNGFEIYEQDFTSNRVYKFGALDYMEYEEYYKHYVIGCKITYTHLGKKVTYIHSLMRIKYVHELQHALRLCGINLEINI